MNRALRRMVGRPKKTLNDPPSSGVVDADGNVQFVSQSDEITSSELERYLSHKEKAQRQEAVKERDLDDLDPSLEGDNLIQALFTGAPQFSVKKVNRQWFPSVSFPWDFRLEIRDASDCLPIQHPAFSASTTYSHLVPQFQPYKHTAEYGVGIREVPNMLHATGREPGTVGFVYFLQEPLSDAFTSTRRGSNDTPAAIKAFRENPESVGVRPYDATVIAKQLQELGKTYRTYCDSSGKTHMLKDASDYQVYSRLFKQLLVEPSDSQNKAEDPTGLKVQIKTLINLLTLPDIWFDFSSAEWRIRLGSLLWPPQEEPESDEDDVSIQKPLTDRQVVILQLTLACELLLRLDAVAAVSVDELYDVLQMDSDSIAEFEALETSKSKWDLWLARYFLRNTEARLAKKSVPVKVRPPLVTRLSILSLITSQPEQTQDIVADVVFVPRSIEQQLGGLSKFAKNIGWTDAEQVEGNIRSSLSKIGDDAALPATPTSFSRQIASPTSFKNSYEDYFQSQPKLAQTSAPRVFDLKALSPADPASDASDDFASSIGGWLTRTYLTGVVLPGEAISHYLISTLLENDSKAMAELGDSVSLYSGFTYRDRSWWSKSCIVGRVLGALKESKECMGWIQTPIAPAAITNSWIDARSEPVLAKDPPRIKQTESLQQDAAFAPNDQAKNASVADFKLPADNADTSEHQIISDGLHFEPYDAKDQTLDAKTQEQCDANDNKVAVPQLATMHFSSDLDGNSAKIPLHYLVSFVSAFPCFPPKDIYQKTFEATAQGFAGHALHKSFKYSQATAADLLFNESVSEQFTNDGAGAKKGNKWFKLTHESASDTGILVIDAGKDSVAALAARAWCASNGRHAVVGRVGTTCLACCITEARVLDIKTVIRVGG